MALSHVLYSDILIPAARIQTRACIAVTRLCVFESGIRGG